MRLEKTEPITPIYIQGKGAMRFSTIKKRFDSAHIEMAKGTALQNREYVSKSGKWEKDKKHETCVDGTFEEWGEMPVERQGARNDLADLHAMVKEGLSDYDILEQMPEAMLQLDKIQLTRQVIVQDIALLRAENKNIIRGTKHGPGCCKRSRNEGGIRGIHCLY